MKSLLLSALFFSSLTVQAVVDTTLTCTEQLPFTTFDILRSQKVITITTHGEASEQEVKEAVKSGEISFDNDSTLDDYDQVTKIDVKIEEVLGSERTTLKDIKTYALEADVMFSIYALSYHDFSFYAYMDESEASLYFWNTQTDEADKYPLICETAE